MSDNACGSYKLHATSRQLYDWTRSEKTRLEKARSEASTAAAARAYEEATGAELGGEAVVSGC
jgi:hypothetical protein